MSDEKHSQNGGIVANRRDLLKSVGYGSVVGGALPLFGSGVGAAQSTSQTSSEQNWTQFQYDPENTGRHASPPVNGSIADTVETQGMVMSSASIGVQPVGKAVMDGRRIVREQTGSIELVFVGSKDGHLYAVRKPPDFGVEWKFDAGGPVRSSPAVIEASEPRTSGEVLPNDTRNKSLVVFSSDRKLFAVDFDGKEEWCVEPGGDRISTPTLGSDGHIYISMKDDSEGKWSVYKFTKDGEKKWEETLIRQRPSSPGKTKIAYAPAVDSESDRLYVEALMDFMDSQYNDKDIWTVFCLDKTGGGKQWFAELDSGQRLAYINPPGVPSTPTIGRGPESLSYTNNTVKKIYVGVPVYDGGVYAIATESNSILDVKEGDVVWKADIGQVSGSVALYQAGLRRKTELYAGTENGDFYKIGPGGNVVWKADPGNSVFDFFDKDMGPVISSPVIGDSGDSIVFCTEKGHLFSVQDNGDGFNGSWSVKVDGPVHSTPSLDGESNSVFIGGGSSIYSIRNDYNSGQS